MKPFKILIRILEILIKIPNTAGTKPAAALLRSAPTILALLGHAALLDAKKVAPAQKISRQRGTSAMH